jgi:hypothetical protein
VAAIVQEDQDSLSPTARLLAELIDETYEVLQDADADLADEFERFVGESRDGRARLSNEVRASVLAAWLDGTVAAETLEVQIRTGVGAGRPPRSSTRHNGG